MMSAILHVIDSVGGLTAAIATLIAAVTAVITRAVAAVIKRKKAEPDGARAVWIWRSIAIGSMVFAILCGTTAAVAFTTRGPQTTPRVAPSTFHTISASSTPSASPSPAVHVQPSPSPRPTAPRSTPHQTPTPTRTDSAKPTSTHTSAEIKACQNLTSAAGTEATDLQALHSDVDAAGDPTDRIIGTKTGYSAAYNAADNAVNATDSAYNAYIAAGGPENATVRRLDSDLGNLLGHDLGRINDGATNPANQQDDSDYAAWNQLVVYHTNADEAAQMGC